MPGVHQQSISRSKKCSSAGCCCSFAFIIKTLTKSLTYVMLFKQVRLESRLALFRPTPPLGTAERRASLLLCNPTDPLPSNAMLNLPKFLLLLALSRSTAFAVLLLVLSSLVRDNASTSCLCAPILRVSLVPEGAPIAPLSQEFVHAPPCPLPLCKSSLENPEAHPRRVRVSTPVAPKT